MATRMLIDARHPEETRVAVLKGNRIEEFDFESAEHKQIKGNIYLAKVTRVEPSLQAAFVDFGGNRHGFLAFSEIHPDYYQIPAADREALLAEEQEAAEQEAALRAEEDDEGNGVDYPDEEDDELDGDGVEEIDTSEKDDVATIEDGQLAEDGNDDSIGDDGDAGGEDEAADQEDRGGSRRGGNRRPKGRRQGRGGGGGGGSRAKEMDELRAKRQALRRRYKIQDVIQRRQVLLVQVVKEERGNKGAALTTYLSLAGRYCVLMPNSSHGGGISRKISSGADRKRLKQIVSEMSLPKSMGLIVRTAGLQRTKTEIKRDFDYLARLWDDIRETTLASSAPTAIHSDSDLVKRAIRDIYNREIEEVVVEGEEGYKAARQFMKLLMPSHVRRVKAYSDPVPLFQRYGAEDQLSAMYDPMVQLKSGGYLVINPTEALVSIDINSGRSTKEHGIEQTALATNLEAAREIARQLRLRDMAGLIVIDFIDMEHSSNGRKVEKAMKEALKNDRARIQVGRISGFGLMEMSRQRLRTGVLEATTRTCPHCDGTGLVRTASSAGLSALRMIEDEAAKGKGSVITLFASTEAAVYLLNAKRSDLAEIEERYNVHVEVFPEGEDEGAKMRIQSSGPRPAEAPKFAPIVDDIDDDDAFDAEEEEEDEDEEEDDTSSENEVREGGQSRDENDADDEGGQRRKRRRRRRGGRGRNRNREQEDGSSDQQEDSEDSAPDDGGEQGQSQADDEETGGEEQARKPSRRRRTGRRGKGSERSDADGTATDATSDTDEQASDEPAPDEATSAAAEEETPETGKRRRSPRRRKQEPVETASAAEPQGDSDEAEGADTADAPKPRSRRRKAAAGKSATDESATDESTTGESATDEKASGAPDDKPARKPRRRKAAAQEETPAMDVPESAPRGTEPSETTNNASAGRAAKSETAVAASEGITDVTDLQNEDGGQPRRGWWQRTFGT